MNSMPTIVESPGRILVRGVNWLGDAVMTTPALLRLRERFPESEIALLTPEKLQDLWRHHPAINDCLAIAPDRSPWQVAGNIRARYRIRREDCAIIFPNSPRSALEMWLARIPRRIGYARPWRNWLLTQPVTARPGAIEMRKRSIREIRQLVAADVNREATRSFTSAAAAHQIHDYLHLVSVLGANPEPPAPQLCVTPDEVTAVARKFQLDPADPRPFLGLNPGAEYGPAKRWPIDRFAAAAVAIQKETKGRWLLFGGSGDIEIAKRFEAETGSAKLETRNLVGQTSLRELMALLKVCRVLLTNDTGPMHVAAALGTPVVVPFGSTSSTLTGPMSSGSVRHQLIQSNAPCSPCFLRECPIDFRCMKGISVEQVVGGVIEALKG
jgi:heptosyltransferase-2